MVLLNHASDSACRKLAPLSSSSAMATPTKSSTSSSVGFPVFDSYGPCSTAETGPLRRPNMNAISPLRSAKLPSSSILDPPSSALLNPIQRSAGRQSTSTSTPGSPHTAITIHIPSMNPPESLDIHPSPLQLQRDTTWPLSPPQSPAYTTPILNISHRNASTSYANQGPYSARGVDTSPSTTKHSPPTSPSAEYAPMGTKEATVEDKRRRNVAASARFRIKQKQRSSELERTISDLTIRADELEKEASGLRRENAWLREIVILKGRFSSLNGQGSLAYESSNRVEKELEEDDLDEELPPSDPHEGSSKTREKGKSKSNMGKGKEKETKGRKGKKG